MFELQFLIPQQSNSEKSCESLSDILQHSFDGLHECHNNIRNVYQVSSFTVIANPKHTQNYMLVYFIETVDLKRICWNFIRNDFIEGINKTISEIKNEGSYIICL